MRASPEAGHAGESRGSPVSPETTPAVGQPAAGGFSAHFRRWSREGLARAVEMRRQGATNDEIGRALGKTPGAVATRLWRDRSLGADIPRGAIGPRGISVDVAAIHQLRADGWTLARIAGHMNVSITKIHRVLNGGR